MAEIGAKPIGDTTDQITQCVQSETEKFAKLVEEANVTID